MIQEFEKSEDGVNDGMDIALCSIEGNSLNYAGANNPLWIIRKGDTIYLFSDGFADQFGGENDRKFKLKAYRELLLSIQDQSMGNQKNKIEKVFEDWKGAPSRLMTFVL